MTKQASEVVVPADLRKALAANAIVGEIWESLTPIARRDFARWVESAKQPETRARRVERTVDMLATGKRRPCCYAVVPMNLYKALGQLPKAKAQWRELTADERRDFVDWIESVSDPEERQQRIEQTCVKLSGGKRQPL